MDAGNGGENAVGFKGVDSGDDLNLLAVWLHWYRWRCWPQRCWRNWSPIEDDSAAQLQRACGEKLIDAAHNQLG